MNSMIVFFSSKRILVVSSGIFITIELSSCTRDTKLELLRYDIFYVEPKLVIAQSLHNSKDFQTKRVGIYVLKFFECIYIS